jgi:hypothetical protein
MILPRGFLHPEQHAKPVDAHDQFPVFLCHVEEWFRLGYARVVEHDVELAEASDGCLNRFLDRVTLRHVAGNSKRRTTGFGDFLRCRLGCIQIDVGDADRGAFRRQASRHRLSDAHCAAGHDATGVRQSHCGLPKLSKVLTVNLEIDCQRIIAFDQETLRILASS